MIAKKNLIVLLIAAMCSTGCSSVYQDINKALLVTAMIVDVGENGEPTIYFEAFRPERTTGKDRKEDRVIYVVSGKTVAEVITTLNTMGSNKPNFSHNKIVIFSRKAAEAGLEKYTDLFARDQEHLLRSNVAVYDGKPDELLDAKLSGDRFLGLHFFDLFRNYNDKSAKLIEVKVQNLFNGRYEFGGISVLPMLTMTPSQHGEKVVTVNGAAVLRDFKLVAVLSADEVKDYSIFQNTTPNTIYTIENPASPGSYVSLRSVNRKIKTKVDYDGTSIVLTKQIKGNVSFWEAQDNISLTPEQREQLKVALIAQIERNLGNFFEKYKAQSVDVFNLEEMFRRKYPQEKLDNPLDKAVLKLDIEVNIEGSGNYTGFN